MVVIVFFQRSTPITHGLVVSESIPFSPIGFIANTSMIMMMSTFQLEQNRIGPTINSLVTIMLIIMVCLLVKYLCYDYSRWRIRWAPGYSQI